MSICSSNLTKETTPFKHKKGHKLIEFEDIDLIYSISSLIEDTIKRNGIKKNFRKNHYFFVKIEKFRTFQFIIISILFFVILIWIFQLLYYL